MLPIQTQADPHLAKASGTMRELAASPAGAVVPQADHAACQRICSDQPTEASLRICMFLCETD